MGVPGDDAELPLGEDAIGMVSEDPAPVVEPVVETLERRARGRARRATPEPEPEPQTEAEAEPEPEAEAEPEPAPKRPAKKGRRPSVPSWDEIMFGGGKPE